MITRHIWNNQEIPALGLGCWAIGGPFTMDGKPVGWGSYDEGAAVQALHAGIDAGVRFFDTAQAYGAGHSEVLLGRALKDRPDVLIGTKVGLRIDRTDKVLIGATMDVSDIEVALEASLYRLQRDHIDMVHLHVGDASLAEAEALFDRLDRWIDAGKLGAYGWSTDDAERAKAFPGRANYTSVQLAANVFEPNAETLSAVEKAGWLAVIRSPLAMGLLGGNYRAGASFGADDVRGQDIGWLAHFKDGKLTADAARRLEAVRDLLTTGGRTPAHGALGWLWARSDAALPIPGFKSEAQVADLTGALEKGPLPASTMAEIDAALDLAQAA